MYNRDGCRHFATKAGQQNKSSGTSAGTPNYSLGFIHAFGRFTELVMFPPLHRLSYKLLLLSIVFSVFHSFHAAKLDRTNATESSRKQGNPEASDTSKSKAQVQPKPRNQRNVPSAWASASNSNRNSKKRTPISLAALKQNGSNGKNSNPGYIFVDLSALNGPSTGMSIELLNQFTRWVNYDNDEYTRTKDSSDSSAIESSSVENHEDTYENTYEDDNPIHKSESEDVDHNDIDNTVVLFPFHQNAGYNDVYPPPVAPYYGRRRHDIYPPINAGNADLRDVLSLRGSREDALTDILNAALNKNMLLTEPNQVPMARDSLGNKRSVFVSQSWLPGGHPEPKTKQSQEQSDQNISDQGNSESSNKIPKELSNKGSKILASARKASKPANKPRPVVHSKSKGSGGMKDWQHPFVSFIFSSKGWHPGGKRRSRRSRESSSSEQRSDGTYALEDFQQEDFQPWQRLSQYFWPKRNIFLSRGWGPGGRPLVTTTKQAAEKKPSLTADDDDHVHDEEMMKLLARENVPHSRICSRKDWGIPHLFGPYW